MLGGSSLLLKSIIELTSFLDAEHYAADRDIECESEQSTTTSRLETCSQVRLERHFGIFLLGQTLSRFACVQHPCRLPVS